MAKEVRYMQSRGEVAPALLISHLKSSVSPKLEPIVEEGSEDIEGVEKGVLFLLLLILATVLYIFLYRDVALTLCLD
ncbi:hypothetical protein CJ030_MR7G012479 [Morella rubra]|uniref:Uncharacterized protein n=1 Tax=Morella rubra TaxID=262757 RepID=A0A6A1V6P2_9ROSI|nr:hypothetical protein CJ030_MR7G012479 [Morella rubra]